MRLVLILALMLALVCMPCDARFQPVHTIPVQIVQMADDDGGRKAIVTPDQVQAWIETANRIYTPVGVRFAFDPQTDMSLLKNTTVNSILNQQSSRRNAEFIADQYLGKLVVVVRHGPGRTPTINAFAGWTENIIFMPSYQKACCGGERPRLRTFAHEVGHRFGLRHTHPGAPFKTIKEAEEHFIRRGRNPKVFDGDGLSDTPPDPAIRGIGEDRSIGTVTLDGVTFELPRNNLMSYYIEGDSLTPQQIELARWFAEYRVANNMRFPVNSTAQSPVCAQDIRWTGMTRCRVTRGNIPQYNSTVWNSRPWLLLRLQEKGSIRLVLPVAESGTYRLDIYGARMRNGGVVKFLLNREQIGNLFDSYAPNTMPTGTISLASVYLEAGNHRLEVESVGRREASAGYQFAIDCIDLVKQ